MNSVLIAKSWNSALSKHLMEQEDKDKEAGNEGTAERPNIHQPISFAQ